MQRLLLVRLHRRLSVTGKLYHPPLASIVVELEDIGAVDAAQQATVVVVQSVC